MFISKEMLLCFSVTFSSFYFDDDYLCNKTSTRLQTSFHLMKRQNAKFNALKRLRRNLKSSQQTQIHSL